MQVKSKKSGFYDDFLSNFFLTSKFISFITLIARRKMYDQFINNCGIPESVLDIGVTSEQISSEANCFEEWFPYKDRITAVGIEDASHLESMHLGLKFVQIKADSALPFQDKEFEAVFSNAVIEHITNPKSRCFFIDELCRVGKKIFITTPYQYFPIEHHTGIPFIHFLFPRFFYFLLDRKILSKFYTSENLRILSMKDLQKLATDSGFSFQISIVRLGPFKCHMTLFIDTENLLLK